MTERGGQRRVDIRGVETHGDQHAASEQNAHVPACHLRTEKIVAFAGDRRVDQAEVHTGNAHRQDEHRLDQRAVEIGHAGVLGREAARGAGRHGVTQGVEPIHAREFEHHGRDRRQPHIDHQQHMDDHLRPVTVVVARQRRHLHVRKGHLAAAHRRQHHQREHHHAHAADPRRREAPELQPARQRLHIGKHRRPGGRESRDAFEPRVHQAELAAPDQVGEHPHHAGHEPRPHDDAEPLLVGYLVALADEDQRKSPQQDRQQRREQQGIERRVHAADTGDARREQHERRDEEQHDSDIPKNHVYPHPDPPIWLVSSD